MASSSPLDRVLFWREKLRCDLFGRVLPFWCDNSVDTAVGGYFNCLSRTGEVYDDLKFMWLQGRQVWTLNSIARMYGDELELLAARYSSARSSSREVDLKRSIAVNAAAFKSAAEAGMNFICEHGWEAGGTSTLPHVPHPTTGRVYFNLNRRGEAAGLQRKPFSAAFAGLAASSCGRLELASRVIESMISWSRDPTPLGVEVLPAAPTAGLEPLNTPMILLSLIDDLNCHDAAVGVEQWRYAEEAEWAFKSVMEHHVHLPLAVRVDADARLEARGCDFPRTPEKLTLEWVREGGGAALTSHCTRTVNPGHGIEAGWFLLQHLRLLQRAGGDSSSYPPHARETAIDMIVSNFKYGWDSAGGGGILYFRDVCGWSATQLEADMKLWWPLCEAMIAFAMLYAEEMKEEYLDTFILVAEWVYAHLVDEVHGEWFGYCDRQGRVTHDFKGGPYKGCFHVPRALFMCDQLLGEAEAKLRAAATASA